MNDIDIPPMTPTEREYLRRVFNMTGTERVQRTVGMFNSIKSMIQHKIARENPGLSDWELMIRVAERMYCGDPKALKLLQRARES